MRACQHGPVEGDRYRLGTADAAVVVARAASIACAALLLRQIADPPHTVRWPAVLGWIAAIAIVDLATRGRRIQIRRVRASTRTPRVLVDERSDG